VPSNLLDTNKRPPGWNANDVGFVRPVTNGSQNPSVPTRKMETGDDAPRVPLWVK